MKWSTPEECFEAWKECTRGRPCDYTGLSYDKLRGGSGHPVAVQRARRPTAPSGSTRPHVPDLPRRLRGLRPRHPHRRVLHRGRLQGARAPNGRAILKAAEWTPPHEWAGDDYPFTLTTGRTVYHFHTRTKTGRAPELQAAAPDAWVELCPSDAERLGISRGRPGARLLAARLDRRRRPASAARARASSSSPSTTATGTSATAPAPTAGRARRTS